MKDICFHGFLKRFLCFISRVLETKLKPSMAPVEREE
jgi:hypothetical protein